MTQKDYICFQRYVQIVIENQLDLKIKSQQTDAGKEYVTFFKISSSITDNDITVWKLEENVASSNQKPTSLLHQATNIIKNTF